MARPGIMVYFDIRENFELLTFEEIGTYVMAMLDYGEYGLLPEFTDRVLKGMWRGTRKDIDADGMKYERICIQSEYGNYCKKEKKLQKEPMSYEEYVLDRHPNSSEIKRLKLLPFDTVREPGGNQTEPNYQQSTINSQPSTISTQQSTISSQSSNVICQGANSQHSDYNGQSSIGRGQQPTQVKIDDDILREVLDANRYKANYNK